ncbi:MAG: DUF2851 family protein [Dysgonamonadaceae bacterium]|jgi:hypothetical protein|nr:DUF2851 family protein [Dysgonamonadaceae bacterium]
MESLFHYVWKHKLYNAESFSTSSGIPVLVIDQGIHNTHAGPDFFNAKIRLGNETWAGDVEMHLCSSDWVKHGHHTDKVYNSVILHVVENIDMEIQSENGHKIPQLVLQIPPKVKENYEYLLNRNTLIPCLCQIRDVPNLYLTDWLNALLIERLERKTNDLFKLLKDYKDGWGDVFYITLSRNFGFGINNDAFERLARNLPLRYVMKHKDSLLQVEALFFGQAGLLNEDDDKDDYYRSLKKEYDFLRKKFKLNPLESHIFKSLRIRPSNFPHIKIAQLATLVRTQESLFSKMLETDDIQSLRTLFIAELSEYWDTHYLFGKTSSERKKIIGLSAQNAILINTVVPVLFTYGKIKRQPVLQERAIQLLESIKPECNYIVNEFAKVGIMPVHAGDSQALIQLQKEYCEKKKCVFCRIGHKLLSK